MDLARAALETLEWGSIMLGLLDTLRLSALLPYLAGAERAGVVWEWSPFPYVVEELGALVVCFRFVRVLVAHATPWILVVLLGPVRCSVPSA